MARGYDQGGSHHHRWHQDLPAANQELLGAGSLLLLTPGRECQLLVPLLRSKSHPVESAWVSTTVGKAPRTLSGEEQGVAGLPGNPEPPSRGERQQVVLSWYVTGKPFPPPQNTDSPEQGWKCRVSVATNIFVQGAARTPRVLPPKGAPHLPAPHGAGPAQQDACAQVAEQVLTPGPDTGATMPR